MPAAVRLVSSLKSLKSPKKGNKQCKVKETSTSCHLVIECNTKKLVLSNFHTSVQHRMGNKNFIKREDFTAGMRFPAFINHLRVHFLKPCTKRRPKPQHPGVGVRGNIWKTNTVDGSDIRDSPVEVGS